MLLARTSLSSGLLNIGGILRHLLAGLQPYICLFPVRTIAGKLAPAPLLALKVRGSHRIDLHFEDLLHRFLHLSFGGLRGDLEHQRALRLFRAQTLFRDHRLADDLIRRLHYATSALRFGALAFSESCSFSSAGLEKIAVS